MGSEETKVVSAWAEGANKLRAPRARPILKTPDGNWSVDHADADQGGLVAMRLGGGGIEAWLSLR